MHKILIVIQHEIIDTIVFKIVTCSECSVIKMFPKLFHLLDLNNYFTNILHKKNFKFSSMIVSYLFPSIKIIFRCFQ